MVKRLLNWLKIGLQAGFGPNFTVEFEAEIQKNLGWPNDQAYLQLSKACSVKVDKEIQT